MGRRFALSLTVAVACLLTILPSPVWAEVTVTAEVDREQMDPGDLVTFSVNVSTDEEVEMSGPILPSLSEFTVIKQGSSMGARSNIVLGPSGPEYVTRVVHTYEYVLQPVREGTLTIGPVEITVGGRRFTTKSQTVRVFAGGSGQAPRLRGGGSAQGGRGSQPVLPPGFPQESFDEDDLFQQLLRRQGILPPQGGYRGEPRNPNESFFVQVEVDKTSVYQDEQVTASWYLYTRGQIRDLDTLKYPALRGFWKEDIEIATQLNFQQEVINGVPYRKALLATFALFPIKPGVSVIDEYKVRCSIFDSMDAFLGTGRTHQYTKSSMPVKIHVKALPKEGQPADFSGAVGNYQVSARVDDPNVAVGEPFSLRIRFEGKGNAKRIDLPPIDLPDNLELHETQQDAKFFRTGTSYRDFTLLLVPKQEGELTIPSISASIFDPTQEKYVQVSTQPITVRAIRGAGTTAAPRRVGDGKAAEKPHVFEPQVVLDYNAGHAWSQQRQAATLGGGLLLVIVILLVQARSELGWGQRKRDLSRRLQTRFRKVNERASVKDWRGVGVEITNTVYFVLGEVSGQGGATVELEKLMLQAPPSVRREIAEPVLKLMDSFQALSFAPDEVVGDLRSPERVKTLVSEMQALLEKAVSLGLSAERGGEPSTDPRAS